MGSVMRAGNVHSLDAGARLKWNAASPGFRAPELPAQTFSETCAKGSTCFGSFCRIWCGSTEYSKSEKFPMLALAYVGCKRHRCSFLRNNSAARNQCRRCRPHGCELLRSLTVAGS